MKLNSVFIFDKLMNMKNAKPKTDYVDRYSKEGTTKGLNDSISLSVRKIDNYQIFSKTNGNVMANRVNRTTKNCWIIFYIFIIQNVIKCVLSGCQVNVNQ